MTVLLASVLLHLPASFILGPRYLFEKYQDAMAINGIFGYPKLFITFTCNPRWTEISDALRSIKGHRPENRPNLVSDKITKFDE